MKYTRLPALALATIVPMLFQSALLAVEHPNPGVSELEHGQHLPVLDIQAGGEISVKDKGIIKMPWSSKSFETKGRVQLVQYIAASPGAARQNKLFNDTLISKRYSSEQLDTTVIVHMADTMSFAKSFVVDRMAKSKLKHETINFVIDNDGVGLQRWGMKNKSSAVIVLDASGKVLFSKDGPLSEIEIENTIKLIEKLMI